ncbi:hypothetical protein BaRGS_00009286 [Batillaria attramentaria]|uniref:Uncharacterized protein n=1 Tax=Batillaria attramentaria TaxID=370345 RepID=A0ABD0LJE0_9CAEN
MIEGTADSGIEFDIPDIVSLLSGEDCVELVEEATNTDYHDLKSRVVVGRWVVFTVTATPRPIYRLSVCTAFTVLVVLGRVNRSLTVPYQGRRKVFVNRWEESLNRFQQIMQL